MGNRAQAMSMKYAILGLVVLAAAASAQTYASSSSYTSGYASATTSGAVTITQQVTLSITAAQYTGNVKTVMETAYGIALGIYTTTGTAGFKTGCSVSSSAARLTTTVLNNAVASAKTALGSAYSSVTVSVTGVSAPAISGATTSGASQLSLSLAGLAVMVMAMRH